MKHSDENIKKEICRVMKILHEDRLLTATGGNVSARAKNSEEIWITPRGAYKANLRPNDLVKVDLHGNIIEGKSSPSIEMQMHLQIYMGRPDVGGIIHSHPPFTMALSSCDIAIDLPISVSAVYRLPKIPIVNFAMPGSKELAELVSNEIKDADVVVLRNHGLITVGSTLSEALYRAQILEENSKIILIVKLMAHVLGKDPITIPDAYARSIRELSLRRREEQRR
jgi:L-fuculose-phosphate aldolase